MGSDGIVEGRHLVESVASTPGAALVATVVGPGGTGKSTLLRAVARAYDAAGAAPGTEGGPVLVDDAHLLGTRTLHRLTALAAQRGSRLVVAHRPWPVGPALTALQAAVARHGVTVGLDRLDRDGVRARVARLLGRDPGDAVATTVHEHSGGLPLLVDTVTRTLDRLGAPATSLPPAVVQRWRHLVDAVPADVRLVLEALAVGSAVDAGDLAELTGLSEPGLTTAVEAARATGYVDGAGRLAPFARGLLLAGASLRVREMQRSLASAALDRSGSLVPLARRVLATGLADRSAVALLEEAATEALPRTPATAAELFAGAVTAGGDPATTAARRCGAVAIAGDLDAGLRLADAVLAGPATTEETVLATATAAVALAHRGFLGRSAALTATLPPDHPTGPVWAVPALLAVGDAEGARKVLADAGRRGLAQDAGVVLGTALLAAVDGEPQRALSGLCGAAVLLEPVAATTLLPDTPAAQIALLALQTGEAGVGDVALRRAAAGHHGGACAQARHLLLHGWILLLRGRFPGAQEALDRSATGERLQPRDELFAAALQVALARRTGSTTALAAAWRRARAALLDHPVDLHTLLPLGELTVAAALLHDDAHLVPHLDDATRVLRALGDPVAWTAPLRWAQAQAAVAAGRRAEAQAHVDVLDRVAPTGPHPSALAAAARAWVQVRWGTVDQEVVVGAARGLAAAGLPWEGAKLAGQAAARAEHRGAAAALHVCARELFRTTDDDADEQPSATDSSPRLPAAAPDEAALSERELEVGRLILGGLTYRQIGEELYISAKTVENHVGRMRRRLGAESRNELFDRLRALVAVGS